MTVARARRLAHRVHQGQLFEGGGPFVDHLARVVERVGEWTADPVTLQAAWLYACRELIGVEDLVQARVATDVIRVVEVLRRRDELPAQHVDRIVHIRRATLVWYAVLIDRHRHLAGGHGYEWWREHHERLADALSLPRPPAKPASGEDESDPRALPGLLAARASGKDNAGANAAIYRIVTKPGNAASPQVTELVARWWDSADPWEQAIAVRAVDDRAALMAKLSSPHHLVVHAAIEGLHGPHDTAEIEALGAIVSRPDPGWSPQREAAIRRLVEIGGPRALAALDGCFLAPGRPPWRLDRDWLRRNGERVTGFLVERLTEPAWRLEATYALGELRARQAVGPLCQALTTAEYGWVFFIEALGKIGAVEAVPVLLEHARHHDHEVRDHALRALAHIDDPRVGPAAIAACYDPHPEVRDRAARVLARRGDERAVPQLIRLCDTHHAPIAAEALARVGDARAVPTLWRLFAQAPDRLTRHAAGRALARIDEARMQYVYGARVEVRRAYMWLLGHKPQWSPRHHLVHGLHDEDAGVRVRAAEALAHLGDPATVERIQPLLGDPDARVRRAAAAALQRLAR